MTDTPLEISCEEVQTLLDSPDEKLLLIDCREQQEHDLVNLSSARLIPMGEIPSRVDEIAAAEGRVVIHCHHGMRSAQTAEWLRANGIPQAQSMAGGIDAWAVTIEPGMPRY